MELLQDSELDRSDSVFGLNDENQYEFRNQVQNMATKPNVEPASAIKQAFVEEKNANSRPLKPSSSK